MKKYAPLATLVSVVLLGAALLVVNIVGTPDTAPSRATATGAAAATPTAPPVVGPTAPAAVAPEPAAPPPVVAEKAYTGRSAGNEVTVAVAVKDGRAVAYVCDGKKVEAWLEGTVTGAALSLTGTASSITGTVDEKAGFGTVIVDGKEWPFSARGVAAPAGLYEGRGTLRGVATRVGWIVDGDGNVTGVVNRDGRRSAAPPLDPDEPEATTIDGAPLTVSAIAGDATVVKR